MTGTILEVITEVLKLIHAAFTGDQDAQQRLAAVLPSELHTRLVSEAQDRLDVAKFGPRPERT